MTAGQHLVRDGPAFRFRVVCGALSFQFLLNLKTKAANFNYWLIGIGITMEGSTKGRAAALQPESQTKNKCDEFDLPPREPG